MPGECPAQHAGKHGAVRYEISYRSDYHYDAPVAGNLNRLRMRPSDGGTQRTEHFDVRVAPEALRHDHHDLFGNHVVEVLVAAPHQELTVEVDALVATTDPLPAPQGAWPDLRTDGYRAVAGPYRFDLEPQPDPAPLASLLEAARGDTPAATVDRVMTLVKDRFAYTPGVTSVDTTVEEFVAGGAGVCQDFAHLAGRLLRAHDIAARYVSGYFFTTPDADGESAEVETHAWVEALLPVTGEGSPPVWHGIDPTNGIPAGKAHVKIGHGRVYADVPPVEGTFSGRASSTVDAHVSMRRLPG
jgi:transglutaminase-like putative cysteine protease